MNLVTATVLKVLEDPKETSYGWSVKVVVDSWGHTYETTVVKSSLEAAKLVKAGYSFET